MSDKTKLKPNVFVIYMPKAEEFSRGFGFQPNYGCAIMHLAFQTGWTGHEAGDPTSFVRAKTGLEMTPAYTIQGKNDRARTGAARQRIFREFVKSHPQFILVEEPRSKWQEIKDWFLLKIGR